MTKENLVKTPEQRVRRNPVEGRNKLKVKGDTDPNYVYRIVNDIDDRINDFLDAGWEFDTNENIRVGDSRVDEHGRLGKVRTISVGVTGMMGQGQGIYNLGLTQQQAPWQTLTGFNNSASPYTGFGSTTGAQSGNMLGGAMGGALMGGQLYNAWKGNAGQTTSAGQNMSMAPSFNINSLLG